MAFTRFPWGDPPPPSLFELIRGIVRGTDSLRPSRAQNMKSYAEAIEITC
jgi:hypothetical protein